MAPNVPTSNQQHPQTGGRVSRAWRQQTLGAHVARLLSGAWAKSNEPDIPGLTVAELTEITPLLCRSGAGALAWRQLRNTPLATTSAGRELHEVYRRQRLSALIHEREVAHVFELLDTAGIDAVLVKGWAIARRYPDRALRPYGDIDLCIRPDQYEEAGRVLKCLEEIRGHHVDLHHGFGEVGQAKPQDGIRRLHRLRRFRIDSAETREWDELFNRSQLVPLEAGAVDAGAAAGEVHAGAAASEVHAGAVARPSGRASATQVRILRDEDHLRLLCQHLLRSGAHRPPWLCDVALLVEKLQSPKSKVQSPTFNWDLCLGRDLLYANWVASAVMLAHELLGADISQTPFADRRAPRWLAPAVLGQWGGTRFPAPASTSSQSSTLKRALRLGRRTVRKGSAFPETDFTLREATPADNGGVASRSFIGLDGKAEPYRTVRRQSRRFEWCIGLGHSLVSLFARWDNPVRATAAVGGQFNNWPRLPYQLAESIMRLPELPKHVWEWKGSRGEQGSQRGKGERGKRSTGNQSTGNRGRGKGEGGVAVRGALISDI